MQTTAVIAIYSQDNPLSLTIEDTGDFRYNAIRMRRYSGDKNGDGEIEKKVGVVKVEEDGIIQKDNESISPRIRKSEIRYRQVKHIRSRYHPEKKIEQSVSSGESRHRQSGN